MKREQLVESVRIRSRSFYVDLGMEPDEYDILRRREEEAHRPGLKKS